MNTETILTTIKKIKFRYVALAAGLIALIYFVTNYAVLYVSVKLPENIPKVIDHTEIDHLHNHSHDEEEEDEDPSQKVDYRKNIVKEEDKADAKAEVSAVYDGTPKIIGKPGIHIIKRSTTAITATAGNSTVSSVASVPWYGFMLKNLTIKLDTNADKLAYKSTLPRPCGVYSESLDRIAQYDCSSPRVLSIYNTPNNTNWVIQNIANLGYQQSAFTQYKGGLIGLAKAGDKVGNHTAKEDTLIQTVSPEGAVSFHKQPENIECNLSVCVGKSISESSTPTVKDRSPVRFFTDTKNQANNRFILADSDGAIHLGTPGSNGITYKKIAPPEEYNTATHQTLCDINGARAVCYQGLSDNPPSVQTTSKASPAHLTIFNFDNDDQTTIKLRDDLTLNYLGVTKNNEIFIKEKNSLIYLQTNGEKAKEVLIASGVDKVSAGSDTYYTYNNGVYKVDSGTLNNYLVFRSDHIAPDKLMTTDKSVVLLGRAPHNVRNLTYAWKLNSKENLTPGLRIIDRLPSAPGSVAFGTTDLVGDTIYIQTFLDRGSSAQQKVYVRNKVIKSLRESGINTDKFQIIVPGL